MEALRYLPLCAAIACGAALSLAQDHTRPALYVLAACAIFALGVNAMALRARKERKWEDFGQE